MTLSYWPTSGDSSHGGASGEDKWEQMEPTWLASGVIQGIGNEFGLYADSTGMRVKIPSGRAWLDGTMVNEDAAGGDIIVNISASDPSNARIDRVVIRRDFVNHTVNYVTIAGAPAVSPVPPSINRNPQGVWDLSLAQVRVNAAAVTIAPGNVTDERFIPAVGGYAAQANTSLRCWSTAHPTSYPVGGLIYEQDTGNELVNTGSYSSPAWVVLQLGAVSPESFYVSTVANPASNYAVTPGVMFVFCQAGIQVTLPAANITNRPITVVAVTGNSTVIAAQGSVAGGSVDQTSGTILNGTLNQGDGLTFKAYLMVDGVTWVWQAVY